MSERDVYVVPVVKDDTCPAGHCVAGLYGPFSEDEARVFFESRFSSFAVSHYMTLQKPSRLEVA